MIARTTGPYLFRTAQGIVQAEGKACESGAGSGIYPPWIRHYMEKRVTTAVRRLESFFHGAATSSVHEG